MRRFVPIAQAFRESTGPLEFFRAVAKLKRGKHRMDWPDWERFFELAQEHMLVGEYDRFGAWVPAYPAMQRCLLLTWRSYQAARARGITPWQWQLEVDRQFIAAADAEAKKQLQYAEQRKANQACAASYQAPIVGKTVRADPTRGL